MALELTTAREAWHHHVLGSARNDGPSDWLARILGAIRDFADADYQERVWARGDGPEVDSSTEAVCRLLDDYDLPGFLSESRKKRWLLNEQLAALRTFEAAVDGYLARDDDRSEMRRASQAPNGKSCGSVPEARSRRFPPCIR